MRICSGPGCLRAIKEDVRFCDECKPTKTTDGIRSHTLSDRERFGSLYTGAKWQRTRDAAVRACPMCAMCGLDITVIVDHIVPSGVAIQQAQDSKLYPFDKFAGFYFASNLQGLCRACHWTKTEQGKIHVGEWPDVVAKERAAPKRKFL